MPRYVEGLPSDCPPEDATPMNGAIYRGLKKLPIDHDTIKSHRELNMKCDRDNCECWGTSVWISREHVTHAQRTISFVRRWYIAEINITDEHGVIKRTGRQLNHYTFWRDCTVDFAKRSTIIMYPMSNKKK